MPTYSINTSCSCGAKFQYSDTVSESYYSHLEGEHRRFLEAHQKCREIQAVELEKMKEML